MCRQWRFLYVLLASAFFNGCSEKPPVRPDDEPTQADRERFSGRYRPPPAPPPLATALASTGDPDHDFLRRMSDHHAGLIVLTHAAIESNRSASLQPSIRKIEEDHDHELDTMLAMLQRIYKDRYLPAAPGGYTLMAQTLRAGPADTTSFFRSALKSEELVLQMINDYLPKAKNAQVRSFADALKRDQPREIAAIRKTLNRP